MLRDEEWEPMLDTSKSFCEKYKIYIPDINARYTKTLGESRCYTQKGSSF